MFGVAVWEWLATVDVACMDFVRKKQLGLWATGGLLEEVTTNLFAVSKVLTHTGTQEHSACQASARSESSASPPFASAFHTAPVIAEVLFPRG
jgi:hypothetical protein